MKKIVLLTTFHAVHVVDMETMLWLYNCWEASTQSTRLVLTLHVFPFIVMYFFVLSSVGYAWLINPRQ